MTLLPAERIPDPGIEREENVYQLPSEKQS